MVGSSFVLRGDTLKTWFCRTHVHWDEPVHTILLYVELVHYVATLHCDITIELSQDVVGGKGPSVFTGTTRTEKKHSRSKLQA